MLEEIGYGLVGGVAAGVLGALALRFAARRSLVEPHWLQILTVASALLAAGIATGLGGSIFIAAFTGGFVFGVVGRDSGGEVSYLVDEGGELLNAVTFIVFGAAILGPALDDLGWEVARLRGAQPDRRPDGAGRALAARAPAHAARRSRSSGGSARAASRRSSSR